MLPKNFIDQLNSWGRSQTPFFFLIDFECKKPRAWKLPEIDSSELKFDFNGFSNSTSELGHQLIQLEKSPPSMNDYQHKFDYVFSQLEYGNSFLTNLTVKTPVTLNCSLENIFHASTAKYKLWLKDQFVVFSPECFIKIKDGCIHSYPMKGTIEASVSQAKEKILSDFKELAEHVTIVDLIRNDLSIVASDVSVTRFRFVEEVKTQDKTLLQVSSEITGKLAAYYASHIGDLLSSMLPAGSISGAPKTKTIEIIQKAEQEERGYFTGVAGYFDGEDLDSAVLIRFIEQNENNFFYRSGGGITTQSKAIDEYNEVIAKIYVSVY